MCTFLQVKDAMGAVALLHNHILQGPGASMDNVKGKTGQPRSGEASAEGTLLWARQVSGEGAHLKKWRLILRNLPFNVRAAAAFVCPLHLEPAFPSSLALLSDSSPPERFCTFNGCRLTVHEATPRLLD